MSILQSRARLLLALLPLIAVGFYLLTYNSGPMAGEVYKPPIAGKQIVMSKEPPATGTPKDFTAAENLSFAAYTLYNSGYFESYTTGVVTANVMGGYDQKVKNTRKVKNKSVFVEAISISSFVKSAEQKYISGNSYLYRGKESVKGDGSVTWSDSVSKMTADVFANRYGAVPIEICKYIVNEETILSSQFISEADGEYTFEYILDPQASVEYYKNEVRTMANAKQSPTFDKVKLTLTVDAAFRPIRVVSDETYSISLFGGTTCTGVLTEEFKYIGETDRTIPEAEIFLPYVTDEEVPEGDDLKPELGVVDYLNVAFSPYMSGQPLNLNAKIDMGGLEANLNLNLNIDTMEVHADLNGMYVHYDGKDRVYFKINDVKFFVSIEEFKQAFDGMPIGLIPDLGGMFGEEFLASMLEDATVEKSDGQVAIIMPINIASVSVEAKIVLDQSEDDELTLNSISGNIDLMGKAINISATPITEFAFPEIDESFVDMSGMKEFVKPIYNTVTAKSFDLSFGADYNGTVVGANAKINIINDKVSVSASLNAFGQNIDVVFKDNIVYMTLGEIRLKADANSVDKLYKVIESILPTVNMTAISGGMPTSLESIFALLESFELTNGALALKCGGVDVTLNHNGRYLSDIGATTTVADKPLNITGKINSININEPIIAPIGDFVDVGDFSGLIDDAIKMMDAKTFAFDVSIKTGVMNDMTGKVVIAKTDNGADINLTLYSNDNVIDLSFIGGDIFLRRNGIAVALDKGGIAALKQFASELMPSDLTAALDFGSMLTELDLNAVLADALGAIKKFKVNDGVLNVQIGSAKITLALAIPLADGLKALDININTSGLNLGFVADNFSYSNSATILEPVLDKATYIEFSSYIAPLFNTIKSPAYNFAVSLSLNDGVNTFAIDGNIQVNKTKDKLPIEVDGVFNVLNEKLYLKFVGGVAYVEFGQIKLKLAMNDLGALADAITALTANATIGEGIASFTSSLPSLDIDSLLNRLVSLNRLDDNSVKLSVDLGSTSKAQTLDVVLKKNVTSFTGLQFVFNSADISVDANVDISLTPSVPVTIDGEYLDIMSLTDYFAPIKQLADKFATANKISFDLNVMALMSDNSLSENISGKINLFKRSKGGMDISIELKMFTTANNPENMLIEIIDGNLYITTGNVKLKHEGADTAELVAILDKFLPEYLRRTVASLVALTNGSQSELFQPFTDLVSTVGSLQPLEILNKLAQPLPPACAEILGLPNGSMISVLLPLIDGLYNNELGNTAVSLDVFGLNFNVALLKGDSFGLDLSFNMPLGNNSLYVGMTLNNATFDTSVYELTKDGTDYADLLDFIELLDRGVDTFTARDSQGNITFEASDFQMSFVTPAKTEVVDGVEVVTKEASTTIGGTLKGKLVPKTVIDGDGVESMEYLINLYIDLNIESVVDGAKTTHSINATVIDVDGNKNVYFTYNGVKMFVDFNSILKLVSGVTQILNVSSPILNDIIGDNTITLDTSIFKTMNIVGLDGLQGTLDGLMVAINGLKEGAGIVGEFVDAIFGSNNLNEMSTRLRATLDKVIGENAQTGTTPPEVSGVSAIGDMFGAIVNGVKLKTVRGYMDGVRTYDDYVEAEVDNVITQSLINGVVPPVTGVDMASVRVTKNFGALNAISVTNLDNGGQRVNMNVNFSSGEEVKILAPVDSAPAANGYNDFSSLTNLIEDVIRTANDYQYNISGKITGALGSWELTDIPLSAKVKVIEEDVLNADKTVKLRKGETLAHVRIQVPRLVPIVAVFEQKRDVNIYYYDNMLYFIVDFYKNSWFQDKYQHTEYKSCTPENFMGNMMDWIQYLLPLGSTITDAIKNPDPTSPDMRFESIFKGYSYDGAKYNVKADLGALTGIKLAGTNLFSTTSVDIYTANQKIDKLYINLPMKVTILSLNLNLDLKVNYGDFGHISFAQGDSKATDDYTIDNLPNKLNSFNFVPTVKP